LATVAVLVSASVREAALASEEVLLVVAALEEVAALGVVLAMAVALEVGSAAGTVAAWVEEVASEVAVVPVEGSDMVVASEFGSAEGKVEG
jgi:hypothetical protein